MGEDAVTIDGEESAAIAGTSQEAAVGSESERVDDIFARRPKLFRVVMVVVPCGVEMMALGACRTCCFSPIAET